MFLPESTENTKWKALFPLYIYCLYILNECCKNAQIAVETVQIVAAMETGSQIVIFNVFKDEDLDIYSNILGKICCAQL